MIFAGHRQVSLGGRNACQRLGLRAVLLLGLLLTFSVPGSAQQPVRRVLLLHSFERKFSPYYEFSNDFSRELSRQFSGRVNFYEVSLQPAEFSENPLEAPVVNYLQSMFSGTQLDLVVAIGGPAARFIAKYQAQIFPSTPVLLTSMDLRHLQTATLTPNDAVVGVTIDGPLVVQNILQLRPKTTHIYVVIGNSTLERYWREELERDVQPLKSRLTFVWWDKLSLAEMVKQSAALESDAAIFYVVLSLDSAGVPQTEENALAELHAHTNAPIFGLQSTQVGRGTVGGPVMAIDTLAQHAASAAVRILNGEKPASVQTAPQAPGPYVYDWRELRRWNIDANRLPPGSIVKFRELTVWQKYKWYIGLTLFVGLAETLLILALIANLVERRRAERKAREVGKQLLHAQEAERARIARELHDDITQRLARMSIDADSADSAKDPAAHISGMREKLMDLSEDVHSLAYRLHPALLERLGLANALTVECERFSHKEGIPVSIQVGEIRAHIPHDAALCLFRVTQEALSNVTRHAHASAANVAVHEKDGGLQLSVSDTGIGFALDQKAQHPSLGLQGMRERVYMLNGKITITSNPGRGTTIVAWVPLDEEPKDGTELDQKTSSLTSASAQDV